MTTHQPSPSTLDGYRYRRWGPVELYCGDAAQVLAAMPDASVDCLVTSPPFWGHVDFTNFRIFPGQNPRCLWCSFISRGGVCVSGRDVVKLAVPRVGRVAGRRGPGSAVPAGRRGRLGGGACHRLPAGDGRARLAGEVVAGPEVGEEAGFAIGVAELHRRRAGRRGTNSRRPRLQRARIGLGTLRPAVRAHRRPPSHTGGSRSWGISLLGNGVRLHLRGTRRQLPCCQLSALPNKRSR